MTKRADSCNEKSCPRLKCEPDDPAQSARFVEFAKDIETENTPERFERIVKHVVSYKPNRKEKEKPQQKRRAS
jgi:hypothetical protein